MIFSSGQPFEHESVMSAFQRHSEKQFPIHRDRRHKHNMTRMVTDIIMAVPIVRGTQSSSGEKSISQFGTLKCNHINISWSIAWLPPARNRKKTRRSNTWKERQWTEFAFRHGPGSRGKLLPTGWWPVSPCGPDDADGSQIEIEQVTFRLYIYMRPYMGVSSFRVDIFLWSLKLDKFTGPPIPSVSTRQSCRPSGSWCKANSWGCLGAGDQCTIRSSEGGFIAKLHECY